MKCEQLKEHLVEYLYDELPAELRLEVESALESCPECTAELEELRLVHDLAASVPRLEVPPKVHNDILREARLHASKITAKQERQRFSLRAFFASPAFASATVLGLVLTIGLVLSRQGAGPSLDQPTREPIASLGEADEAAEAETAAEPPMEFATGEESIEEITLDGEMVAEGPRPSPVETNAAFAPLDPAEPMDNFSRAAIDRELEEQAPAGQEPETELTVVPQFGRNRTTRPDRGSSSERNNDDADGYVSGRTDDRTTNARTRDDRSETSRDEERRSRGERDRAQRQENADREPARQRESSVDDGIVADLDDLVVADLDDSRNEEMPQQFFDYGQTEGGAVATPEVPEEEPQPEPDELVATLDTSLAEPEEYTPPPVDTVDLEAEEEMLAALDEEEDREATVAQAAPQAYLAEEASGSSAGMMEEDSDEAYGEGEQTESLSRAWDIPSQEAYADRGRAMEDTPEDGDGDDLDTRGIGTASGEPPPVAPTTATPRGAAGDGSVASTDPDPLSELYAQGLSRYNDGSYRDAIYDFDAFIQNAPSTSNYFSLALYHQALAHMRLGDYGSAIENLERVITLDPGFEQVEDARFRLARAYELNGDFDRAEELYRTLAGESNPYEDQSNEGLDRLRERRRSMYRDEVESSEPADAIMDDYPAMDSAEKPTVTYKRH